MMIVMISIVLAGVFVLFGWYGRGVSHVVIPFRDPILWFIAAGGLAIMCMGMFLGVPSLYGAEMSVWICTAWIFYFIGHLLNHPGDCIAIVELNTRTDREHAHYLVKYYNKVGDQCMMPQSLMACAKAVIFNIHNPLDMDLSQAYTTRTVRVDDHIMFAEVPAAIPISYAHKEYEQIDICRFGSRKVTDSEGRVRREPRFLLHPWVVRYTYIVANTETADPVQIYLKKRAHEDAIFDAARTRTELTKMRVAEVNAKYAGAGEIVRSMMDLDLDGDGIPDDLEEIIRRERKRRAEVTGDADASNT